MSFLSQRRALAKRGRDRLRWPGAIADDSTRELRKTVHREDCGDDFGRIKPRRQAPR